MCVCVCVRVRVRVRVRVPVRGVYTQLCVYRRCSVVCCMHMFHSSSYLLPCNLGGKIGGCRGLKLVVYKIGKTSGNID